MPTTKNSFDYVKVNETLIELDDAILASSMIDKDGSLVAHSIRKGYESELSLDKKTEEMWGTWASIVVGVVRQSDKVLSETEYIAIGSKDFKGLIIPLKKWPIIVRLTLKKKTESTYITEKVIESLKTQLGK